MQIQPIDITQIIVAIITTAGVVYSVRQQRKQQEELKQKVSPRKINRWMIVMSISLILLVANLWIFWERNFVSTTEVEITYPYDGASVEIREMVRGISQKVPEGHAIWIVVYSHVVGRYYPQNYPADVQANGDWASLIYIGTEEDTSKKFDIIAVIVNKSTQDIFNAYLTQAKDKKTWPGLERLPEGAAIYDRITVTRR